MESEGYGMEMDWIFGFPRQDWERDNQERKNQQQQQENKRECPEQGEGNVGKVYDVV